MTSIEGAFVAPNHNHRRCVKTALESATRVCAERGSRLTAIRALVLTLVWESHKPVTAYELLDRLRKAKKTGAAPPTVYRALEFLLAHDLVHRIESMNAFTGCGTPGETHDGQFLLCTKCKRVAELQDTSVTELIDSSARLVGFKPERQTIEVRGLCPSCTP